MGFSIEVLLLRCRLAGFACSMGAWAQRQAALSAGGGAICCKTGITADTLRASTPGRGGVPPRNLAALSPSAGETAKLLEDWAAPCDAARTTLLLLAACSVIDRAERVTARRQSAVRGWHLTA